MVRPLLLGKTLYVGHWANGDRRAARRPGGVHTHLAKSGDRTRFLRQDRRGDSKASPDERRTQHWPSAPLEDLILMSADPVAAELAKG